MGITVLGGGESGIGAALLAKAKGHIPFVSDFSKIDLASADILSAQQIEFEQEQHTEERILSSDLIIKSPGIPDTAPLIQKIKKEKIQIISEIEFASWYCTGKIIAITGSNGKTTVSSLIYHIVNKAGLNVALVGNIGKSFAWSIADGNHDYYVVEVSSFQLDDIKDFKPNISILTNISPDHLDRYDYKMDNYVNSKFRITENQDSSDFFIYNHDDEYMADKMKSIEINAEKIGFSQEKIIDNGAYINSDNKIEIHLNKQEKMSINDLALQGKHNQQNSMAAGLAAKLLGIRKEVIRESLSDFESIEHRLEPVLQIYGIQFINDSKATNINSTWYALDSLHENVIWILGGVDKGNDYSQLNTLASEKVKAIVCIGDNTSKIHAEFENIVPFIVDAADISEAVNISYKLGDKGDTVILSPACASFDWFENYEDRGRQFKEAVRRL